MGRVTEHTRTFQERFAEIDKGATQADWDRFVTVWTRLAKVLPGYQRAYWGGRFDGLWLITLAFQRRYR